MYYEFLKLRETIIGERYVLQLNRLKENNLRKKALYWTWGSDITSVSNITEPKCWGT